MGSVVIIAMALVALVMTGTAYYVVMPFAFNIKEKFMSDVSDTNAIAFGNVLYDVVGVFPLLFVGAVFVNAYQKSTRQNTGFGF